MSPEEAHFRATAPAFMRRLLDAFPVLGDLDAAAVFGNAGHESKGLTDDQEDKPVVKGSAGGRNWMQWTGPRRRQLEAFAAQRKLDPDSDEAAFAFLVEELRTTEKRSIAALRKATTLEAKTEAFMAANLRPGVKHLASRIRWARIALEALRGGHQPVAEAPTDEGLVRAVQQALWDKGYTQVGMVDGKYGRDTRAAIAAFELDNGLDPDGKPTHEILARILAAAPKPVSAARAEATPADVRVAVPEARATWQAQLGAFWGMVVSFVGAAMAFVVQNLEAARDLVQPALNVLGDVPVWAYAGLVGGGLLFLWWRTRSAGHAQVAAFRAGERR
jgi:peptidoglycan hydrolase-like protein with peptidoglycan-binding domain